MHAARAAAIDAERAHARLPAPMICVRRPARFFFFAAIFVALASWGAFVGAVISSSIYGANNHPMAGYEWLPGALLVPGALLLLVRYPRADTALLLSDDDRERFECAVNIRLAAVVLVAGSGVIIGAALAFVVWFEPPACRADVAPAAAPQQRWFVTPSPSPKPAPTPRRCDADPTTGSFLLAQLGLGLLSVFFAWRAAAEPPPRPEDDLDGGIALMVH